MEKNASATYGRALASDRSLMFKGLLVNAARRTFALLSAAALLCSVSACAEVVPTDSCSHTPPPMQTDSKQEAALELMAVSEPPPETEPETEPPQTERCLKIGELCGKTRLDLADKSLSRLI